MHIRSSVTAECSMERQPRLYAIAHGLLKVVSAGSRTSLEVFNILIQVCSICFFGGPPFVYHPGKASIIECRSRQSSCRSSSMCDLSTAFSTFASTRPRLTNLCADEVFVSKLHQFIIS